MNHKVISGFKSKKSATHAFSICPALIARRVMQTINEEIISKRRNGTPKMTFIALLKEKIAVYTYFMSAH